MCDWREPRRRRPEKKHHKPQKQTKIHIQALLCTNCFHLVPNGFLLGSYRFPMGSLVHWSVPTNFKWFPNCSSAHTLFQERFKDVQVGSRWFSTLHILSPNFHTFFRPSPLRLSPGRHTVFVLMNELVKCMKQRPSLGSQKRSADHYAVRSLVRPINEKQHKPNKPKHEQNPQRNRHRSKDSSVGAGNFAPMN